MNYLTNEILMVRPAKFYFNKETAVNNIYQNNDNTDIEVINQKALEEFDNLVSLLRKNGIIVNVIEDTLEPSTPDSIFPNNCFSTDEKGKLFIYPMFAANRRKEINKYIDKVEEILFNKHENEIEIYDYRENADFEKFLEGTGSMILDRKNRYAYMCLSPRSNKELFEAFCKDADYTPITFEAEHNGEAIYHTNVLLNIGVNNVLICAELIAEADRNRVIKSFEDNGKNIIELTVAQYENFAGNALELRGENENVLAMSKTAYDSLTKKQINEIEAESKILYSDVSTIEFYGGGSVRCMLAELF